MVQGKAVQYITDATASSECVVCEATPKIMNKIDEILRRPINVEAYRYRLASLIAWIALWSVFYI